MLELPKYLTASNNMLPTGGKHQWFHFFLRAYGADPATLLQELPDPVFAEALGILQMIQRSPEERRFYESRLKHQRDEQARLDYAREEGEIKGEIMGEIKGRILTLQEILGLAVLTKSEFDELTVEELQKLLGGLQEKLRNRPSA